MGPEFYATSFQPISTAMCKLISYVIDPVYRLRCRISPKLSGKQMTAPNTWNYPKQVRNPPTLIRNYYQFNASTGKLPNLKKKKNSRQHLMVSCKNPQKNPLDLKIIQEKRKKS